MTAPKKVKKPTIPRMRVMARRSVTVEITVSISSEKFDSMTNAETRTLKKKCQEKLRAASITPSNNAVMDLQSLMKPGELVIRAGFR